MKMDDDTPVAKGYITIMEADSSAFAIIHDLGHLPLSIDLVGAYMETGNLKLARYLKHLREDPTSYLDFKDTQSGTGRTYGKTVMSVWALSFKHIKDQDPLAASLL